MADYVLMEALKTALQEYRMTRAPYESDDEIHISELERIIDEISEPEIGSVLGDKLIREMEMRGGIEYEDDGMYPGYERIPSIGPASLDLHLGNSFSTEKKGQDIVVLGEKKEYNEVKLGDDEVFTIEPGEFVLATTTEYLRLPKNVCAMVHGRSSIGRLGLTVQNAGFVDPGFYGEITLELKNETRHPIGLVPGYRVAQLVFMKCSGVTEGYKGKYNGQRGATGTRMHEDAEAKEKK